MKTCYISAHCNNCWITKPPQLPLNSQKCEVPYVHSVAQRHLLQFCLEDSLCYCFLKAYGLSLQVTIERSHSRKLRFDVRGDFHSLYTILTTVFSLLVSNVPFRFNEFVTTRFLQSICACGVSKISRAASAFVFFEIARKQILRPHLRIFTT